MTFSSETLRWIYTGAAALLIYFKNRTFEPTYLVPLVALQAPQEAMKWIRGEFGMCAAFVALLLRLFNRLPGEAELPLVCVLLAITAPHQALELRGNPAAMVACAGAAAYLGYQHYSRVGGMKGAFNERNLPASVAIVCLVAIPCAFVLGGF